MNFVISTCSTPGILLSMRKPFSSVGLRRCPCGKTSSVTCCRPAGGLFTSS